MRDLVLTVMVMIASAGAASGRQDMEFVRPTAQIPRAAYKTWSLFLICNPDWAAPEKSDDLADLYHRFNRFGDAIGHDNLAVWFWKRQGPVDDAKLSENVDVARSAEFCRVLQRPPSLGPYLVVTSEYPDIAAFPKDRAILELGGLPPAEIAKLLNRVTDQLLLQRRVTSTTATPPPAATPTSAGSPAPAAASASSSSVWVRLLEGTRQSIVGFGCQVKLQVDAGPVKAELKGCAGL
jgi:hypothetical protein